jgi:hypothetical protein
MRAWPVTPNNALETEAEGHVVASRSVALRRAYHLRIGSQLEPLCAAI